LSFGSAGAQNVNVLLFSSDLESDVELIADEVLSNVRPAPGVSALQDRRLPQDVNA
jgi:hypothetical protein